VGEGAGYPSRDEVTVTVKYAAILLGLGALGGWQLHKLYLRRLYKWYVSLRRKIFKGR